MALKQNPKPTTVALAARTPSSRATPARARARTSRSSISNGVYDKTYPPATTDFTPIVRALQAANADIVIICSYPLSSVGIVQAVNELNYKPKLIGGAMVGLQATVFKQRLGPKLNGIVNYETWVPSEKMMAPAAEFFKKYQARAGA
jgi:branched-chain amino acid transport system substrate-binding protein